LKGRKGRKENEKEEDRESGNFSDCDQAVGVHENIM
jgi:hypothetical protein